MRSIPLIKPNNKIIEFSGYSWQDAIKTKSKVLVSRRTEVGPITFKRWLGVKAYIAKK